MRSPLTITDVRKAAGTLLALPDADAIIANSDSDRARHTPGRRDLSLRIGTDVLSSGTTTC